MAHTTSLFPQFGGSEADLYSHYGLLGPRTILAHCCHMDDHELARVAELSCGVAHCPASNMTVGGGFMAAPVRRLLSCGVKVGLGTDSGGGFSSSMLDAMRLALVASNAREVASGGADRALTIPEVFYLATAGGAGVCCLDDRIGSFAVGKEFDAVLVNTAGVPGTGGSVMTMVEDGDAPATVFEKFVMTGDDRNMERVYVRGRSVKV
ncbi:guanine deaminase [Microdochium nivale]|nr:guanine deaminase [Microdochium nivale]